MAPEEAGLDELQKNVLSRLKKIEGQIRGIHGMVEKGKECQDILIQVRAVKSAIRSMTQVILKRYLLKCFQDMRGQHTEEELKKLEETVKVLTNFVDG